MLVEQMTNLDDAGYIKDRVFLMQILYQKIGEFSSYMRVISEFSSYIGHDTVNLIPISYSELDRVS